MVAKLVACGPRPATRRSGGCAAPSARRGWRGSRPRSRSSSPFSTIRDVVAADVSTQFLGGLDLPGRSPPLRTTHGAGPRGGGRRLGAREPLASGARPSRDPRPPGGRPGPPSDTANEVPREGRRPVRGAERRGGGPARPRRRRASPSTGGRARWDIVPTPGGGFSILRADGRQAEAVPRRAPTGTEGPRPGRGRARDARAPRRADRPGPGRRRARGPTAARET